MDLLTAAAVSMLPAAARRRVLLARRRVAWGSLEALLRWLNPGDKGAAGQAGSLREQARDALDLAAAAGIEAIGWDDARYPVLLASIADPPPVLWLRGRQEPIHRALVAIVGSRAASPYALEVATRLGHDLAARDVVVVSGLARGVDSAAHRGALDARGATVAVLGSGVDVMYPPEHATLAAAIAEVGAVVSEFPPGTPPRAEHFPLRNRIISALALAVVVVEAGEGSGSLITAECALDQGREVMVVPGSVLTGRYRGSHALLKDGALLVEGVDDILTGLGRELVTSEGGRAAGRPARDPVVACMAAGEAYDLDSLAVRTGLDPASLLPALLELELRGLVARTDGGRFVRSSGRVDVR